MENNNVNIYFLLGFMGSGKTTIGKKAAKALKIHWVDLDHWIIEKENKSIPDIFEEHGELHFRSLEKKYLSALVREFKGDTLIALGGGTPCFNDMMDWLNEKGQTIYLSSGVDHLVKMLSKNKDKRPLLKRADDIKLTIEHLLNDRKKFYEKAQFTIPVDQFPMDVVADYLVEFISSTQN